MTSDVQTGTRSVRSVSLCEIDLCFIFTFDTNVFVVLVLFSLHAINSDVFFLFN